MPTRSRRDKADGSEVLTERLIRGRMRFRREFTGDIVAWLLVQSQRYARAAQTTRDAHRKTPLPGVLALADRYAQLADYCATLAADVVEPWSKVDWLGIVAAMHHTPSLTTQVDHPDTVK